MTVAFRRDSVDQADKAVFKPTYVETINDVGYERYVTRGKPARSALAIVKGLTVKGMEEELGLALG
jgi:hypothetical protein